MRKIFKIIWLSISSILIFILLSWIINQTTQHIITDVKIENFKNSTILQDNLSSSTVKMYKVEKDEECGFMQSGSSIYPGNKCDVIVSRKSGIMIPFVQDLVTFFAGGHASLVMGDYRDYNVYADDECVFEATGMNEGLNLSEIHDRYYWSTGQVYDEVIVLRANNLSEEQKDEVISNAVAHLDDPYNYSFTFDTVNKSYCSDLMSKCFEPVGINLNKNGFWTTIYDLIVSNDCHIVYYHYYKDGIKYIYYVG